MSDDGRKVYAVGSDDKAPHCYLVAGSAAEAIRVALETFGETLGEHWEAQPLEDWGTEGSMRA